MKIISHGIFGGHIKCYDCNCAYEYEPSDCVDRRHDIPNSSMEETDPDTRYVHCPECGKAERLVLPRLLKSKKRVADMFAKIRNNCEGVETIPYHTLYMQLRRSGLDETEIAAVRGELKKEFNVTNVKSKIYYKRKQNP